MNIKNSIKNFSTLCCVLVFAPTIFANEGCEEFQETYSSRLYDPLTRYFRQGNEEVVSFAIRNEAGNLLPADIRVETPEMIRTEKLVSKGFDSLEEAQENLKCFKEHLKERITLLESGHLNKIERVQGARFTDQHVEVYDQSGRLESRDDIPILIQFARLTGVVENSIQIKKETLGFKFESDSTQLALNPSPDDDVEALPYKWTLDLEYQLNIQSSAGIYLFRDPGLVDLTKKSVHWLLR